MKEIIRIGLDNEMDLILAHKRSIKLAELCGLMASSQTRFATAVSEIARCAISSGQESYLVLGINSLNGGKKEIVAVLYDKIDLAGCNPEAFNYAKRLVKDVVTDFEQEAYSITLAIKVPYSGLLSEARIASFSEYFKKEAPLSAYDEIRKKNIQLIELADQLTESENSYRQLTDTLPFIVFSVSKSDKIFVTNKNAQNILGKEFKEFSAAAISQLFYAGDAEQVLKVWGNAKKKQSVQSLQVRLVMQSSPVWHQLYIVPNTDERDHTSGWIITMVNIHAQKLVEETLKDNKELKLMQEELRRSNDELQKKNSELEQFAYVASHDLQEPLRKIRNFISLADRTITPEQRKSAYLDKISASAERMSLLVRDILNYSTVASGSEFSPTNLNSTLEEVLHDLELPIAQQEAHITFERLPEINAIGTQMNQLFYNFISNALKFTASSPQIKISYSLLPSGNKVDTLLAEKPYHRIAFEDNGIGIEEQYRSKIFSIFQRLHPQSTYQGTGIGLSLCKRIAENHQGTITVDSTPGKGSTFTVYLPQYLN